MKKGFTMIELLGVFTLTGIILMLTIPQITSLLKKSNDEEYQTFLNSVYIAAEAYIEDANIEVPKEGVTITIGQLIKSGFLKSTLVNPENNETVVSNKNKKKNIVVTKNSNNVLEYSLQD